METEKEEKSSYRQREEVDNLKKRGRRTDKITRRWQIKIDGKRKQAVSEDRSGNLKAAEE